MLTVSELHIDRALAFAHRDLHTSYAHVGARQCLKEGTCGKVSARVQKRRAMCSKNENDFGQAISA
jgi:hypothetical protein